MRIAIFGTGAAGGYFGAQLARTGEELIFIARGEHLRAIQEHGLRIETMLRVETSQDQRDSPGKDESETSDGGFVVHSTATNDPTQVGEVDFVLVGVKAWQVKDAASAMLPMIGAETVVVPLQNGVDAAADLASVLGAQHVLNGLCGTISRVVGPGHILSIGKTNFIKFGEFHNKRSERVERLQLAFERAGVKAEVPLDVEAALWEKFIFVAPYGGVGALSCVSENESLARKEKAGRTPAVPPVLPGAGVIRSSPETRSMVERGMEEILAVARARKIGLADGIVKRTMALLDSLDPNATTSLQRDIAAGKPSELEAWNGAVVRLGKESGVSTPVNELIYSKLLSMEARARGVT